MDRTPLEAQQVTTIEDGDPLAQILMVQVALQVLGSPAMELEAQATQQGPQRFLVTGILAAHS